MLLCASQEFREKIKLLNTYVQEFWQGWQESNPQPLQLRPNRHHFPLSRVLRRWQLAHRTSHLAISAAIADQGAPLSILVILADLLPCTWSNSRTRTSV